MLSSSWIVLLHGGWLRWEEEALASRETVLEGSLTRMVDESTFNLDEGGPILECSYKEFEAGLVGL